MKEIGKIVSVHGVEGDLVIAHHISNQKSIYDLSNLLVEVWTNSFIPFFIEEINGVTDNNVCVKFEEINSREEAKNLLNKKVYLFDGNNTAITIGEEWDFLSGYQILDQDEKPIGLVKNIITNGPQVLLEVRYKEKLIQLPLHQDLLIELNKEKTTLQIEIADGLLEVWD